MSKILRLFSASTCLFTLTVFCPVQAAITTINCNTAVHLSDFMLCAINQVRQGPGTFWYVAFNSTQFTTVKITSLYIGQPNNLPTTVTAYQPNGAVALTDADLKPVDKSLIGTIKKANGIPNLNIDPDQVYSLIGVEFPEVLTRQINGNLLSLIGPLYTEITPVGTTVMVTCPGDGTSAQYVRISLTGTVQWEMVPGTLKNKAGKFIDSSGKVIGTSINNLGSPGFLSALPNFLGVGLAAGDWLYWPAVPGGTATIGNICVPDKPC